MPRFYDVERFTQLMRSCLLKMFKARKPLVTINTYDEYLVHIQNKSRISTAMSHQHHRCLLEKLEYTHSESDQEGKISPFHYRKHFFWLIFHIWKELKGKIVKTLLLDAPEEHETNNAYVLCIELNMSFHPERLNSS